MVMPYHAAIFIYQWISQSIEISRPIAAVHWTGILSLQWERQLQTRKVLVLRMLKIYELDAFKQCNNEIVTHMLLM